MAELLVRGDDLIVHLRPLEKFGSFHTDIAVPLTAITSVAPVFKPWLALRGWRMAGIAMRGVRAIGTWRHGSGYDFCMVRRDQKAVQIDVASGRFVRFLICVPEQVDPVEEAGRIAAAAGIAPSGPAD